MAAGTNEQLVSEWLQYESNTVLYYKFMQYRIQDPTEIIPPFWHDENDGKTWGVMGRLKEVKWRINRKSEITKELHTRSMRSEYCRVSGTVHAEEAPLSSLPMYDVFLGGSCGTTRSSLFLFVIDPATVNATSFLEIAYFAARKSPKLVVVFLGKTEWKQKAHPDDLPDRNRTCMLLDRILDAHDVPMLYSIQDALDYIEEEIIGSKRWSDALRVPCQRLSFLSLRTKRVARAAQFRARGAWLRMISYARHVTLACAADAIIFIVCQMVAPNIPIYFILLPLFLLNIIVIFATERLQRRRSQNGRVINTLTPAHIELASSALDDTSWVNRVVAYMLGHTNWQVTVCVPKEAECLEAPAANEDEVARAFRRRRNDCYQIAFCYLKDMAKRRQCRIFSELEDALQYMTKMSSVGS
ncbi:hypothetical protein ANCCEY_13743 [Ancylostoma ceylanicum]|uniref:Uncharacterized protein n=1 Tax=Ancylostoma ceylanicum TaxID=53326 RepID=A0A0D6LBH2_9BILA|nr:hypothetical protein ANCCEY_13743 [Ancylostoma ceylanicum]